MKKRIPSPNTVFCLASYFKGNDFIRECKNLGHRIFLLTRETKLSDDWALGSLDGIIPVSNDGEIKSFLRSAAILAITNKPTHIVALEEADVITAGRLREHFGLPGMVGSHARLFRDKLAMRHQAARSGIRQAEFVHLLNYQEIGEFMERIRPPWLLKPRADASAVGITKLSESEEVWRAVDRLNQHHALNERADNYVLEEFVEGDVFHVDSLVIAGRAVVARANRYGSVPLEISVYGGISTSHTIEYGSKDENLLFKANEGVLKAFAFEKGVTHTEFIKDRRNGEFYFLETSARVGGAFTAEGFEAATGLNIWKEWARIEMSTDRKPAVPKPTRREYAGIIVSLAKQKFPDTSSYTDPEIFYRARREHHAALVLRSPQIERVKELLDDYSRRFKEDFMAIAPQPHRSA